MHPDRLSPPAQAQQQWPRGWCLGGRDVPLFHLRVTQAVTAGGCVWLAGARPTFVGGPAHTVHRGQRGVDLCSVFRAACLGMTHHILQ